MSSVAELAGLLGYAEVIGDPSLEVSGLSCDSRSVEEGDLFVCVTGFQSDGHRFAADALAKGAKALVVEKVPEGIDPSVTLIKVGDTRRALAVLSAKYFGCPADKMLNVGITGTNGKTTTAYLTEAVLKAGGYNPGLLGTIEAHVAGKVCKLANTTPGAYDLHSMFSQMHDSGQDSVVMEVSSHALALDRVYGIPFDVAVFTNLTQDHLDFHKTMENYFSTKSKLFTRLGIYDGRAVGPGAAHPRAPHRSGTAPQEHASCILPQSSRAPAKYPDGRGRWMPYHMAHRQIFSRSGDDTSSRQGCRYPSARRSGRCRRGFGLAHRARFHCQGSGVGQCRSWALPIGAGWSGFYSYRRLCTYT